MPLSVGMTTMSTSLDRGGSTRMMIIKGSKGAIIIIDEIIHIQLLKEIIKENSRIKR